MNSVYHEKLKIVEELLQKKPNTDDLDEVVITQLGNGIRAHESVPTAIYCFLRAQNEIPRVEVRYFLSNNRKVHITFNQINMLIRKKFHNELICNRYKFKNTDRIVICNKIHKNVAKKLVGL